MAEMINYFSTVPLQEPNAAPETPTEGGLVVVGVNNFDSDTFSFPPDDLTFPYVTITDVQRGVIRFSILRS